ncbi:helix-turn-helix transcriptional regulator [Mumia zhuanghuii]|uniref:Helix-turn-helix domain-containing protein n=2 Tax=Mumia TaxID=1546255 RepID=A0ABW1QKS0_9ACTN|nr:MULTISPECIES: helix-turn-helix transcriptional regulator [Mumia]KAA1419831.1 helix-turn-helix transcriptional regulator [Mumia zhuanghuii]
MSTPLGDFVRARRDATSPESLGLTPVGRRRAPGLRRMELAALAGISVEYLTRIEQGRDRNPSIQVVHALAEALRLDVDDREHLRNLTKATSGECVSVVPHRTSVRPAVQAILDQLEPGAAAVVNRIGDILALTTGFDQLVRPLGVLDTHEPNLTRYVFTDERARRAFPEWDRIADERVAELWRGPSTDRSRAFVSEMTVTVGDAFTRRLERHASLARQAQRWTHPSAGELRLDCEILDLPVADGQQIMVLVPADDATTTALESLRRRGAGSLRAV